MCCTTYDVEKLFCFSDWEAIASKNVSTFFSAEAALGQLMETY